MYQKREWKAVLPGGSGTLALYIGKIEARAKSSRLEGRLSAPAYHIQLHPL